MNDNSVKLVPTFAMTALSNLSEAELRLLTSKCESFGSEKKSNGDGTEMADSEIPDKVIMKKSNPIPELKPSVKSSPDRIPLKGLAFIEPKGVFRITYGVFDPAKHLPKILRN